MIVSTSDFGILTMHCLINTHILRSIYPMFLNEVI